MKLQAPPPYSSDLSASTNLFLSLNPTLPLNNKVGPITVGLDATTAKLKAYTGGVHAPAACKDWVRLDHAVLIVGYGVDGGVPYWRVKNSWGDDWGEGGYFRIKRGVNMCGIAMDAVHSKP